MDLFFIVCLCLVFARIFVFSITHCTDQLVLDTFGLLVLILNLQILKMAHRYENNELVDMLLIYGECLQSAAAASVLYADRFPLRNHPTPRSFLNLIQRARNTGDLREHRGGHAGRGRRPENVHREEQILNLIEEDPTTSTRVVAGQVGLSQTKVWTTLRENQFNPFHVQRVQALLPEDFPRRVQFCEWFLQQHENDQHFSNKILVMDEATFTRNGMNNFRNTHVWSIDNPHAIRRTNFQHRFSANVWAGIVNGILVGPFILPDRLTGDVYLDFLQNNLPVLLEDVPLNIRQAMWLLQDGAPAHFRREVREFLDIRYPNRWIGRNGPVAWPPRSPDLNPCDFFLWGYMKSLVFKTPIDTQEELIARIEQAAATVRQKPISLLRAVTEQWLRRANRCVEVNGDNFEQLM